MTTGTETEVMTPKEAIVAKLKTLPDALLLGVIRNTHEEYKTKPEARLLMFYALDEFEARKGTEALDKLMGWMQL